MWSSLTLIWAKQNLIWEPEKQSCHCLKNEWKKKENKEEIRTNIKSLKIFFDSSHTAADQYCKNLTFIYVFYSSIEANVKLTVFNQLGLVIWFCTKTISDFN